MAVGEHSCAANSDAAAIGKTGTTRADCSNTIRNQMAVATRYRHADR